jgi:hypothetical protein
MLVGNTASHSGCGVPAYSLGDADKKLLGDDWLLYSVAIQSALRATVDMRASSIKPLIACIDLYGEFVPISRSSLVP